MKILNPLDLAKGALNSNDSDEEEQRVVQLFRNRAELKKAYTELQDEIHRLKDRLKQQEGATARMREMLEHLEDRLGSTETGYPALAFYQLRKLWANGAELLRAFCADLEKQQVEREKRTFLAEVNRSQFAKRQMIEGKLRDAEAAVAEAGQQLSRLHQKRARLAMPWHHFKRRRVEQDLADAQLARSRAEVVLHDARRSFEELLASADVPFPGLSIDARRSVNLAVIAYAELLALRLAKTGLLAQARAAVLRREPSDDYGDRSECEALMTDIARAQAVLQQRANLAQEVKARTEELAAVAVYRAAEDTVPAPESTVAHRSPPAKTINVLGEDLWDVFKVLLR